MPHFVLASIGTDGDIFPYLGMGTVLRARGHRATLLASEDYREKAQDLGLEFRPLASKEENRQLLSNPDFWHPIKGGMVGAHWGASLLPRHYALLAELARDEDVTFVANAGLLTARVVQEKFGRPLATPLLQPGMIQSSTAPPALPAAPTLPRWAPRPVGHLYWGVLDAFGSFLLGRALHDLRGPLGLPPVKRFFRWWLSPQLVLGMFPQWYAPPQPDWPPQIKLTGFPRYDGGAREKPLDEKLVAFCASGEPPVAFTFGTGMMHAKRLFGAGVEACRILGRRGVVLTKYAEQLPAPLPDTVHHATFASFRRLFPRCAAVAHHGGVGTVAECFAAGVPQAVLPIAWDQKDNAIRVKRLGAGDWMRAGRATGPRLASLLRPLISPGARANSWPVAARLDDVDALATAANYLEDLASTHAVSADRDGSSFHT
jgi:UDP:flavonoid glycosyltransferase YjiC (YdhE family)